MDQKSRTTLSLTCRHLHYITTLRQCGPFRVLFPPRRATTLSALATFKARFGGAVTDIEFDVERVATMDPLLLGYVFAGGLQFPHLQALRAVGHFRDDAAPALPLFMAIVTPSGKDLQNVVLRTWDTEHPPGGAGAQYISTVWEQCPKLAAFESIHIDLPNDCTERPTAREICISNPDERNLAVIAKASPAATSLTLHDFHLFNPTMHYGQLHLSFIRAHTTTNLQKLVLVHYGSTVDYSPLEQCLRLQMVHLRVWGSDDRPVHVHLPLLPAVTDIEIEDDNISETTSTRANVANLSACTQLRRLYINVGEVVGGIPDIPTSQMQEITVLNNNFSGKLYISMGWVSASASTLTRVDLLNVTMRHSGTFDKALASLFSLTHLKLQLVREIMIVVDLNNHPRLRTLDLYFAYTCQFDRYRGILLRLYSPHTALVDVTLAGNSWVSSSIGALGFCPALERVSLGSLSGLTSVACLASLPQISYLDINTDISPAITDLDALDRCPRLQRTVETGNPASPIIVWENTSDD